MCNNKYKLICLDLDGTLLNSKHRISEISINVLQQAERSGMKIAIATGRAAYDAIDHGKMISKNSYYIGANGAIVGSNQNGRIIGEKVLTPRHLELLMDLSETHRLKPLFFTADRVLINGFKDYILHLYFTLLTTPKSVKRYVYIPNKKQLNEKLFSADMKVHKSMFIIKDRQKAKEVEEILRKSDDFELAITANVCFEITEKGMDKSRGVQVLAEHLGIDSSQIIAFGDSENDYKMLKYVGMGVAMGNAPKEIRDGVDHVTETNDNEGIPHALNHIL